MQRRWWPFLCCLALSCAPDRFYVEGTQGWGEIDPAFKDGTYETESYALTAGLSFPLGVAQERTGRCSYPERYLPPAPPVAPPVRSEGQPVSEGPEVPWVELAYLAMGAAGLEATRRGAPMVGKAYKTYRSKKKSSRLL